MIATGFNSRGSGAACYLQRGGGECGVGAFELSVERDAALVTVVRQRRGQVQHLLQAGARLQRAAVPGAQIDFSVQASVYHVTYHPENKRYHIILTMFAEPHCCCML